MPRSKSGTGSPICNSRLVTWDGNAAGFVNAATALIRNELIQDRSPFMEIVYAKSNGCNTGGWWCQCEVPEASLDDQTAWAISSKECGMSVQRVGVWAFLLCGRYSWLFQLAMKVSPKVWCFQLVYSRRR